VWISEQTARDIFELDEMYWFIKQKSKKETRENIYVCTMVSREPRQIVSFSAAADKSPERIQSIVDSAPEAENYSTDGYLGYIDVVYPGKHIRNVRNKSDTFTVEGINADLRHYIPVLARKSRCFCRSLETLEAVLAVFVNAYNKFGEAKLMYRVPTIHKSPNSSKRLHKYRDVPFSVLNFF
jgi:IS1 family transposase